MNAAIDISSVRLTTARLILRPFEQKDLTDFNEYARVDGVGQMAGWLPHQSMAAYCHQIAVYRLLRPLARRCQG